MHPLLTQLLNINEVSVEDYRDIGEHLVLIVEAIKDSATCPGCGQTSHNVHQSRPALFSRDTLKASDR